MIKILNKLYNDLKMQPTILLAVHPRPFWNRWYENMAYFLFLHREYVYITGVVSCTVRGLLSTTIWVINFFILILMMVLKFTHSYFGVAYSYPFFVKLLIVHNTTDFLFVIYKDPIFPFIYFYIFLTTLLLTILFRRLMKSVAFEIVIFLLRFRWVEIYLNELEGWYYDMFETPEQLNRPWYKRGYPILAYAVLYFFPVLFVLYFFKIYILTFLFGVLHTSYFFIWHSFAPRKSLQDQHIEFVNRVFIPAVAPTKNDIYELRDYIRTNPSEEELRLNMENYNKLPKLNGVEKDNELCWAVFILSRCGMYTFSCVFYSTLFQDEELYDFYQRKRRKKSFTTQWSTNPAFPFSIVRMVGGGVEDIPSIDPPSGGPKGGGSGKIFPIGGYTDRAVGQVITKIVHNIEHLTPKTKAAIAVTGTVACIGLGCYIVHEFSPSNVARIITDKDVKVAEITADKEVKVEQTKLQSEQTKLQSEQEKRWAEEARAQTAKYYYKAQKLEISKAAQNVNTALEKNKSWWGGDTKK